MTEIETLLKHDLPNAYGLTRPNVTLSYYEKTGTFELGDQVACHSCKQKFPERDGCNEKAMKVDAAGNIITVVEYEDYLNQFKRQDYGKIGKCCDLLMFDSNNHKVVFCDLGCYSEQYVEKKRMKAHEQTGDSLKRFLCKPCGKEFIDKFSEKILIFGRRNRDINTNTALTRGDVKGNMLAFQRTPVNLSKYTTTEEILNGEMVSFIMVNYPNPYIW